MRDSRQVAWLDRPYQRERGDVNLNSERIANLIDLFGTHAHFARSAQVAADIALRDLRQVTDLAERSATAAEHAVGRLRRATGAGIGTARGRRPGGRRGHLRPRCRPDGGVHRRPRWANDARPRSHLPGPQWGEREAEIPTANAAAQDLLNARGASRAGVTGPSGCSAGWPTRWSTYSRTVAGRADIAALVRQVLLRDTAAADTGRLVVPTAPSMPGRPDWAAAHCDVVPVPGGLSVSARPWHPPTPAAQDGAAVNDLRQVFAATGDRLDSADGIPMPADPFGHPLQACPSTGRPASGRPPGR